MSDALTICPLGLCTFEQVCPNAPCIPCMRRLGEHLIAEMGVMTAHARVANEKGDRAATETLHGMLSSLTTSMNARTET